MPKEKPVDDNRTGAPGEVTNDRELWALALWIEKHYGDEAPGFIAEQVTRLAKAGDFKEVAMWWEVAARFDALAQPRVPNA